jgi:hypothetical protein
MRGRGKVVRGWRKLRNEKLHAACMGQTSGTFCFNGRTSPAKRPYGKPPHMQCSNFKLDLNEIG